ncbi:KilA-N domain-containing protein [Lawsonibacter faecis]|uniref:KilA-N domain-containing protein n=1 Tax=Lawsonibacter faecis TaxID=2763052 RepID=A0A8J6JP28_9FIRM|nr:KilA-N domain-containing protein [Lawsonibacter faecis]MBC5738310.1 KilA-N domain-containing protein [Lawsonibacter faecis]
MTEREAQIEALWTYEVATEKVLRRSVKKGYITQEEAEEFSEKLFEQLNTDNIPGFRPSSLGEIMRMEDIHVNPFVSLTEIAREKKSSSPSYLIQSWLRSSTTIEYLRMWEKIYNPKFQEDACEQLIETVHKTSTTMTPSLWINTTHALGIRSSRGRGGGTIAHPEIAEAFRAWLFPEYMLRLVKWYRMYHREGNL